MVNELFKRFSEFIARMPGLPILVAVALVVINFVLLLLPAWPVVGWLAQTHFLLHLGLVIGFIGILLGEAL